MRERCPSPPRQRPAPPESGISERSPCTSGVSDSKISVGTHATAAGKPVALRPSLPSRAPIPPDWNSVRLNGSVAAVLAAPDGDPQRVRALGERAPLRGLAERAENQPGQEVPDEVAGGDRAPAACS